MNIWIVIGWISMLAGALCLTGIIARVRFGSRPPGVIGCLSLVVIGFFILLSHEALKLADVSMLLTGTLIFQGAMIALSLFQRVQERRAMMAAAIPAREQPDNEPAPSIAVHADVILHYRDSHGQISDRLVTVQHIDGATGTLHGYCHMRHMPRAFRLDRVVTAADPETGEVIADLPAWLAARG
jgi:hypothetical protein